MKRVTGAVALILLCTLLRAEEPFEGYSLEEATAFRDAWTSENWDEGGPLMRYVFLNMTEFWNHAVIHRGGPVTTLDSAPRQAIAEFTTRTDKGRLSLADYVQASTVNGALVLHEGSIVFESYPRMRPTDKHLYMSVSKPLVATLVAQLEDQGRIDVALPVDRYLPELSESGWAGVPVLDVLDMASGIACLEGDDGAYTDPDTCYYQYEASLGWLGATAATPDSPYDYMATLTSHRPSGEAFEYTSPNTFVLQWLVEGLTGRPVADVLSTAIWQKSGAEADALLVAPVNGVPITSGGISSTLRDMARFGLLFTPSGQVGNNGVVSARYLEKIQQGGRPGIYRVALSDASGRLGGDEVRHNTYQWDAVMADGDFFKSGYGSQGLYVSPSRDLVIAWFGTFDENRVGHEMQHVARQLATSGLFDQ